MCRLKELFLAALDRSPADRAAFLDDACRGEPDLRERVEALLASDAEAGRTESPLATASLLAFERGHDDAIEPQIGPYRILEVLGEGGFGSVYLAEQREPVRRRVALKVIKPGMDSRQIIARFEAERQALALMSHPSIARVLDAGTTAQGRLYFVMELVTGPPITDYADRCRLTIDQRLRLYVALCRGVEHAHQKGVLHRDLKPSNILVAEHDGTPVPKIIDFGIAKAMTAPLTERTLVTERSQLIGTPEYMSPEQAELGGVDLDTRSDVYALGVLLYELLCGTPPFESSRLRSASLREMQRIICETDPPRPSDRVGTVVGDAGDVAARRGVPVTELRARLRGDLDWIAMKTLEKERGRRYQSAAALADDVERALRNEPVVAAPPTATYRLRKFVRRHRVGVLAGAAVSATLIVGSITSIIFGMRESHQRTLADEATAAANARAAELATTTRTLEAVVEFQSSMLGRLDATGLGRGIFEDLRGQIDASLAGTGMDGEQRAARLQDLDGLLRQANPTDLARGVIEKAFLREATDAVERDFVDQPLVQASLLRTIGTIQFALGDAKAAEPGLRRAYDRVRPILGEDDRETLRLRELLAHAKNFMGDPDGAVRELEACLDRQRDALGRADPDTLFTIQALVPLLVNAGRYDDALELARESVRLHESAGADPGDTALALNRLSLILIPRGLLDEADAVTTRALAAAESASRVPRGELAHALTNRAWFLGSVGRLPEAVSLRRRALTEAERVFGSTHPYTLSCLGYLSWTLVQAGEVEEALPLNRRAVEIQTRLFGPDHYETLASETSLAQGLWHVGEVIEAEELLRSIHARQVARLGNDHTSTLDTANLLGIVLWDQERTADARVVLESALERARVAHGPDHRLTLSLQTNLALVFQSAGDLDGAAAMQQASLESNLRRLGPEAEPTLVARMNVAALAGERGLHSEAVAGARTALAGYEKVYGAGHAKTLDTLILLGHGLMFLGETDEAENVLREALDVIDGLPEAARPRQRAEALVRLGLVAAADGRPDDAERSLLEAIGLFEALSTPAPSRRAWAIEQLIGFYDENDREDEAGRWRGRLAE